MKTFLSGWRSDAWHRGAHDEGRGHEEAKARGAFVIKAVLMRGALEFIDVYQVLSIYYCYYIYSSPYSFALDFMCVFLFERMLQAS